MHSSIAITCRVCGDEPLEVQRVIALANLGDDSPAHASRGVCDGMTERYINIEQFVVPHFEDAVTALIGIAEQCRQRYEPLFEFKPIATHELYCGLFQKDRKEATLLLLTPNMMQRLCDLRISLALNVYQAD